MTTVNLDRLLDELAKTAYRLEMELHKRNDLIAVLVNDLRVPVRTVATHARISHGTAHNVARGQS